MIDIINNPIAEVIDICQKLIERLVRHIKSNIPFLHKQFTRAMNKTVTVAKAEIDGFYTAMITKLGKEALNAGYKPPHPQIEDKSNNEKKDTINN